MHSFVDENSAPTTTTFNNRLWWRTNPSSRKAQQRRIPRMCRWLSEKTRKISLMMRESSYTFWTVISEWKQRGDRRYHRLNMQVDFQSLFGLHVPWCAQLYSLAEIPQSPPPHLGSYTMALLVSQDRRHLFVTPWAILTETLKVTVLGAVEKTVEKEVEVRVVVPVLSTTNLGLLSMSDLGEKEAFTNDVFLTRKSFLNWVQCCKPLNTKTQSLNMELELQSLFGLQVTWCAQLFSLAETPQPPPPHLGSYARGAIGQPR